MRQHPFSPILPSGLWVAGIGISGGFEASMVSWFEVSQAIYTPNLNREGKLNATKMTPNGSGIVVHVRL